MLFMNLPTMGKVLRIQTWLFRSFRKPRRTRSYASSFRPRQFRVSPFIARVSEGWGKKRDDHTLNQFNCSKWWENEVINVREWSYLRVLQTSGWTGSVCKTWGHFCTACVRSISARHQTGKARSLKTLSRCIRQNESTVEVCG